MAQRLRPIACNGKLSDASINISVGTFNSNQFPSLPVVTSPNFIEMIIDPLQIYGALERVNVLSHGSGATAATVARGQYGSTARTHNVSGVQEDWLVGPTDQDFIHGSLTSLDADDHTQYYNAARHQTAGAHAFAAIQSDIIPVGVEYLWPGTSTSIPPGFLLEDGRAVSRVTYSALYAALDEGALYGNGDGSTTFNLPNWSGSVLVGANADSGSPVWGTTYPIGSTAITAGPHTHGYSTTSVAVDDGSLHTHAFATGVDTFGIATGSAASGSGSVHTHSLQGLTTTGPSNFLAPHAHGVSGTSDNGTLGLTARPRYMIIKY